MAYILTAVGAGGKTTYLHSRAQEYLRQGMRIAITTTTHIWPPRKGGKLPGVEYFGTREESGKLSWPGDEVYAKICREFDAVLVEGDGSHSMPAKIPGEREPVIPGNTDEIVVVMGSHAIGRRLDVVCQRYGSYGSSFDAAGELTCPDGTGAKSGSCAAKRKSSHDAGKAESCPGAGNSVLVTEEILERLAQQYYLRPLRQRFPRAKLSFALSRMPEGKGRIAAVLMASGFGRRYGGNKLLDDFRGKPLYRHALDHIIEALGKESVIVVSQYEPILAKAGREGILAVKNDQAAEGISASIRLGTHKALEQKKDAVMFFAADMPYLPGTEIRMFAGQFLSSRKPYGCMEFGPKHICTNPGAFRLPQGERKLLQLTGDRGAMRIMKQEPWNIYYYQIAPEWAEDVDVRSRSAGIIESPPL